MEEREIKNRIKICFFSLASYPFFEDEYSTPHGGAELQMFLLASFIANEKKYKPCFFVGNFGQKKRNEKHKIKLIRSIKHRQKENIFLKLIKACFYFFQLIKHKPDVIISTNANAFVGINAFYSKLFKKKYIYRTSHLVDVNKEYINNNALSGQIYKYGLLNASSVITQNEGHKDLLKNNHGINATIIRNVVEIKDFKIEEKSFILWVGRFQKWKKPELFLKLATHFPKKEFVMICPYTKPNKQAWKNLKAYANKIHNLKFIEKVPFNEIQEYFNKAELFVNTSDYEGFPNTFLQSALGKTPIVSLNVNPDNFLKDYNCGIFANGNFDNMLSETKTLISNKNELKIKAENLFRYLKENHDIEVVGKEFVNIVESL